MKRGYFHKRVKGFTVQETIIAMVITGLLAALCFTVIRYYGQLFSHVIGFGNQQTQINQLQQVLSNDILAADKVIYNTDLICQSKQSLISYRFVQDTIIRNTPYSVDTFCIEHNTPVINILPDSQNLVVYVSLVCMNDEVSLPITIVKQYPLAIQLELKQ